MEIKEKRSMDSFLRVLAFLVAHPATGRLSYDAARQVLQEAVQRLFEHARAQAAGQDLSRAELRGQRRQVQRLVDEHMRPIVTIAQAQIDPSSDPRVAAALRLPKLPTSMVKLLQLCDGMIDAARTFEAELVSHGLPADFLAQFTAARDELQRALGGRATLIGRHVAAREGLAVEVRRGRRAVARLDAIVRASFANDTVVLAAWRSAKRLQRQAGGVGRAAEDASESAEVSRTVPSVVPSVVPVLAEAA